MRDRTARRRGTIEGASALALAAAAIAACGPSEELTVRRDASRADRVSAGEGGAAQDASSTLDASAGPMDAASATDVRVSDGGCPLGLLACGAQCVNAAVDTAHCGACGTRCAAGANATGVCEGGTCAIVCAPGFADCDRVAANGCEANTRTDRANCGACGTACAAANATPSCVAGVCGVGACAAGFGDCDANPANGCETALNSAMNCGACARACSGATPVCDARAGACASGCGASEQRCGSSCVDTATDRTHCGACGRVCSVANGDARCEAGACRVNSCVGNFADCDGNAANGCEVNTRTDRANCGGCGNRPAEMCNGVDDTCDGVADEGFRAAAVSTSYTVLRTHHDGCDGAGMRVGLSCNAAITRFCAARGCTTSGFGPVENSGDGAAVVCVQGEVIVTTYTALRALHGPCDGVGERGGPNCNAAISRFCAGRGFVSGFGPIENSGDTAVVTCVRAPSARTYDATYTALRALHAPCDGVGERVGPNCNAAINRYCTARGHQGGFGPIENSGDTAIVTCVDP